MLIHQKLISHKDMILYLLGNFFAFWEEEQPIIEHTVI